jgi:asparagine synthase (glutamine-hydrolysing)
MDQPLADPACLPLYHLARLAREHATVCIAGDGGDELFAGYARHRLAGLRQGWASVPLPLRTLAGWGAAVLPDAPASGPREWARKARVGFRLLDAGYMEPLFAGAGAAQAWHGAVPPCATAMLRADLDGQLAGQMLAKTDAMTMAHGLECRVPLLDLDLVGLAAAMPLAAKRQGGTGKLPLRRLLGDVLPGALAARPKRGFRVPLTDWFRGAMAGRVRDSLLGAGAQVSNHLDRAVLAATVDDHLAGRAERSVHIWALLALEGWLRRSEVAA